MKSKNCNREIYLLCPTCGESQFEYDDEVKIENMEFKCLSCNQLFSKGDLIKENGELTEEHFSEMGEEILEDAAKKLRKAFKKGLK
jgi:predicted  nucleic acid-binding Zn-ribbon protein